MNKEKIYNAIKKLGKHAIGSRISKETGILHTNVCKYLKRLKAEGYIDYEVIGYSKFYRVIKKLDKK